MQNNAAIDPGNESSNFLEIEKALRAGNTPGAVSLANKALDEAKRSGNPGQIAEAWLQSSRLHRFLQNQGESIRSLEAGLASLPGPEDSPEFARQRLACLGSLGMSHVSARRYEKGRAFLARAIRVTDLLAGEEGQFQKLALSAPMAWLMLQSGEVEPARELASLLIANWPAKPELIPLLGRTLGVLAHCRARLGMSSLLEPSDIPPGIPLAAITEAVVAYIRVTASPEDGKGALEKPEILVAMARWASGWLERVAGGQSRLTPDSMMMLAEFEAQSGDFPAMAETLGKAAKIYGERSENAMMLRALRGRTNALARAGQQSKALEASNSVLEAARLNGEDGMVAECLVENGHIRIGLGDLEGARAVFSEAQRMVAESPNTELEAAVHLSLAVTEAKSGRKDGAERHLRTVTNLLPESHALSLLAVQNLKSLSAPEEPPVSRAPSPRHGDMSALIKNSLPPELAGRMESILKMAESLPKPGGAGNGTESDPMLAELEARAMQNLQGILGQFKGA